MCEYTPECKGRLKFDRYEYRGEGLFTRYKVLVCTECGREAWVLA